MLFRSTVILPQPTPININTAGRPLLAALLPGIDEAGLTRFEELRQRAPWRDINAVSAAFPNLGALDANLASVATRYFFAYVEVRLKSGDTQATDMSSTTLLERVATENRVSIMRRDYGMASSASASGL